MTRIGRLDVGFGFALALAILVTVWDAWFLMVSNYTVAPGWAWFQLVVVAGAWGAVALWATQWWALAGVGLLLTIGGLWGYFYIPPLVALVLAGVAFSRALRSNGRAATAVDR